MGVHRSCALLTNITIVCWGQGSIGGLGNGVSPPVDSLTPVAVVGITDAKSVAVGNYHMCAVLIDDTVKCWGENVVGQIGDGTTSDSLTPVEVASLTDVASVVCGDSFSCALLNTGAIKCWGANQLWDSHGFLGDGTSTVPTNTGKYSTNGEYSAFLVDVLGIENATQIEIQQYYACAVARSKTVKCWGTNHLFNQLGTGRPLFDHNVPVEVTGITGVTSVAVGYLTSCASPEDGTVKVWGGNALGQFGDGTTIPSYPHVPSDTTPVTVLGITTATRVAMGTDAVYAALED